MSSLAIVVWIANVLTDTAGRMAFKSAARWPRWGQRLRSPALWAGIVCFAFELVLWLALLALIPLSQAILIGSINIVTVAVAGRIIFGERMVPMRAAGIALIAIGVALAGVGV